MAKNKAAEGTTRHYSNIQEDKIATMLRGRRVSNSGASMFNNGDVIVPNLMVVECKTSMKEKASFSIKKEWLDTNEYERVSNKLPYGCLAISFTPEADENYFVINEDAMNKFMELLRIEQEMAAEQV